MKATEFLQQHGIDIDPKEKEEGHREDLSSSTTLCEVNSKLQEMTTTNGFDFDDNSHIHRTCLNGSKLHLNSKGLASLATNFI